MSKSLYIVFALILSLFATIPCSAASGEAGFATVELHAGKKSIHAEVARTDAQRETGLMNRKSLPANNGMLFVFERPAKVCMWMKDTLIPLSVAFIDEEGVIVNIEEMKANTTDSHCSAGWIRYALEMNAHWFSKNGVKTGSRITGMSE